MQIVIDIPEGNYKAICETKNVWEREPKQIIYLAIANGMPLPKGHGRLIDVNDLLDRIGLEDNDRNRADNVGEIITLEDFDFTPTIIEADVEESEEQT